MHWDAHANRLMEAFCDCKAQHGIANAEQVESWVLSHTINTQIQFYSFLNLSHKRNCQKGIPHVAIQKVTAWLSTKISKNFRQCLSLSISHHSPGPTEQILRAQPKHPSHSGGFSPNFQTKNAVATVHCQPVSPWYWPKSIGNFCRDGKHRSWPKSTCNKRVKPAD